MRFIDFYLNFSDLKFRYKKVSAFKLPALIYVIPAISFYSTTTATQFMLRYWNNCWTLFDNSKIEPFIGEKDLYVDFAECKNTVAVVVLCLKMKYGKGLNP